MRENIVVKLTEKSVESGVWLKSSISKSKETLGRLQRTFFKVEEKKKITFKTIDSSFVENRQGFSTRFSNPIKLYFS